MLIADRRLLCRSAGRHLATLLSIFFISGLVYLGFFCVDKTVTDTEGVTVCDASVCINDDEELDVDEGLSHFTLDEEQPLNISRDVLVFLHIQKTVLTSAFKCANETVSIIK